MRITDVNVVSLRSKLTENHVSTFYSRTTRNAIYVIINTDEGIEGLGESFVNLPEWAVEERRNTYEYWVKPIVIGKNPLDIEDIINELWTRGVKFGLQWGALGVIAETISGVDIALWDILGKKREKSIGNLIGGLRDSTECYASGLIPERIDKDVPKLLNNGFHFFKMKIGRDFELDKAAILHLRSLVGCDAILALDANQSLSFEKALKLAPLLKDNDILFLEEPFPANDLENLILLKEKTNLALAGGENYYDLHTFRNALASGALSYIQPDVTKCGGVSRIIKIKEIADTYGVELLPHFFGNGVGLAATLQIQSIGLGATEYVYSDNHPLRDLCVLGLPTPKFAEIAIPKSSGLGISLNLKECKQYFIDRESREW